MGGAKLQTTRIPESESAGRPDAEHRKHAISLTRPVRIDHIAAIAFGIAPDTLMGVLHSPCKGADRRWQARAATSLPSPAPIRR